jgi:hypothetical protein
MTTPIIFEDYLDQVGATATFDSLDVDDKADLELEWQRVICEEAGIPYDGWQLHAGFCARERMKTNNAEEEGVRIIHMSNNRTTAFQYWQQRMSGWNNYGPYGFHPDIEPAACDHNEP